jgi:hypothetical protein
MPIIEHKLVIEHLFVFLYFIFKSDILLLWACQLKVYNIFLNFGSD